MMRLRLSLTVFLCGLLLSFNALAVSLLAIERCAYDMGSESAEMHHDCVGDAAEAGWLESTAGLLCDSGIDCQLGGAVLSGSATLAVSPLPQPAFVTPLVTSRVTPPDTFWRPPRH